MFPRALRLPIGPEALKNGEALASPYFLLKYKPNGLPHHRFAAVVSTRAGKTAVVRHIIKRELLDAAATWPLGQGGRAYDALFIASPRLGTVSKNELRPLLRAELAALAKKLFGSTQ